MRSGKPAEVRSKAARWFEFEKEAFLLHFYRQKPLDANCAQICPAGGRQPAPLVDPGEPSQGRTLIAKEVHEKMVVVSPAVSIHQKKVQVHGREV